MSQDHEFDVFISYATEDKEEVAKPLVNELEKLGLQVWFDENILEPGDSLSSAVDAGLAKAKYGLVILSPNFFSKRWPNYELSGLKARQLNGEQIILPVWHNVDFKDVLKFSAPLADMFAYNLTSISIKEIAEGVLQKVKPESYSRKFVGIAETVMSNLD